MKKSLLVCSLLLLVSAAAQAATVLVEAESFANAGGWKLDTQAVEQMGSPYLLAHGMGVPVLSASTTVSFPAAGRYYVWVRSRNWVPDFTGSQAPGRFKVAVDGTQLAAEFGAGTGLWHWESGGSVTVGANATVALVDLTGFDGRCDAIAFIQGSSQPPPDGGPELAAWRAAAFNESANPPVTQSFDCVVVGGGVAGCCAAVAAARSGITVALVNDRPVLGGNASQEIRVAPRGEPRHSIVLELGGTENGGTSAGDDARRLGIVQAEPNITVFMPSRAYGAGIDLTRKITHVDVRHAQTGARTRLQGAMFIDCTGDGWVGYWAGADYRMGREALSEFGETLGIPQPLVADSMTMGSSVMWSTTTTTGSSSFPAVPWAMAVSGTNKATSGGWEWEYGLSLNTITDAEAIRDHLLRAVYGNFSNAKKDSANANRYLSWVAYVPGKRESRRLMGDHILIESDVRNKVYFGDEVGTATWGIDLHYETAVSYLTWYNSTPVGRWYFPFRCLYSRNVPNLMMAGRCISVSHVGLGSPRVMNTGGQMGVAVGYAAAICKRYGIEPRDIYRSAERTTELKNWILAGVPGGTWPQPASRVTSAILDNTDAVPAVRVTGDWTADTTGTGYYGSNFLHDGNAGQGTMRVAYTPTLTLPGQYSIALRWPAAAGRATNTPVWICSNPEAPALSSAAPVTIRNAQPDTSFSPGEMLVGSFAGGDSARGLLHFDLSTIPAHAVIVSAELQLPISARDAESGAGLAGAEGLRVYRVSEPFTPGEVTWNSRATGTAWSTAGGSFDPGALSTLAAPVSPNVVTAGDAFVFPKTEGLTAAVTSALGTGTTLDLIVRTPSLETSSTTRSLYRFGAATLVVKYFAPQLPATCTVNQQTNGGQWVTLGGYDLPPEGATVIIGNDNANGTVVADAVRFVSLTASTSDVDNDGLPDCWELYYSKSETAADPDGDPDGDLYCNLYEFSAGTNPLDSRSVPTGPPPAPTVRIVSPAGRLVTLPHATPCLHVQAALGNYCVPNSITINWTQLSGPGTVTFGDPTAADTTARFSSDGLYVLQCSAANISGTGTAQITVAVNSMLTFSLREGVNGYSHTATLIRGDGTSYQNMNSGARPLLIVGKTSAGLRSVFSYDLSALQPDVSIQSAKLDLWTSSEAGSGTVGTLEIHALNGTPVEGIGDGVNATSGSGTGVTWITRDGQTGTGHSWTTPGGDFSGTVLSSVPGFSGTNTNVQKAFSATTNFTSAVQSAVSARQPLNFLIYAPTSEAGTAANQYTRISSDDNTNAAQRPLLTLTLFGNYAPEVACGAAPPASSGIAAALSGTVTNSGSGTLTSAWSQVSGPGTASFGNCSQPATTVTFNAGGNYVLRLSGSNAAGETFSEMAVTVIPNPRVFANWRAAQWPGITDANIIAPDADPDRDGIANLMEFALSTSPTAPSRFTPAIVASGTSLEFIYARNRTAAGVTFQVEWSDSLAAGSWSAAGVTESAVVPEPNPDPSLQTFRAIVPVGGKKNCFVRLKVTQP